MKFSPRLKHLWLSLSLAAIVLAAALSLRLWNHKRFEEKARHLIVEKYQLDSEDHLRSEVLHYLRGDIRVNYLDSLTWTVNVRTGEVIPWHSKTKEESVLGTLP